MLRRVAQAVSRQFPAAAQEGANERRVEHAQPRLSALSPLKLAGLQAVPRVGIAQRDGALPHSSAERDRGRARPPRTLPR